jgi:hypothetical protein
VKHDTGIFKITYPMRVALVVVVAAVVAAVVVVAALKSEK